MEFRRLRRAFAWLLNHQDNSAPRSREHTATPSASKDDPEMRNRRAADQIIPSITVTDCSCPTADTLTRHTLQEADACVGSQHPTRAAVNMREMIVAGQEKSEETPPPSYEECVSATKLQAHICHFSSRVCGGSPIVSLSCDSASSRIIILARASQILGDGVILITIELAAPSLYPNTPSLVRVESDPQCSLEPDTIEDLRTRLEAVTANATPLRRILTKIMETVSPTAEPISLKSPRVSRRSSGASSALGSVHEGAAESAEDLPLLSVRSEDCDLSVSDLEEEHLFIDSLIDECIEEDAFFPANYAPPQPKPLGPSASYVIALHSFGEENEGDEDIFFKQGDQGIILSRLDSGALMVRNLETGKKGIVPCEIFGDANTAFLPPLKEIKALRVLTKEQALAVKNVNKISACLSAEALPNLRKRFENMGFTEQDLQGVLLYIRDRAPIVVHVNLTKVGAKLLVDTHYRNQFETGTSGGYLNRQTRIQWEDSLFENAYQGVSDFDRCKYGVLNVVNDPKGVVACHGGYGDSYLRLKEVRLRCTFSPRDSGNGNIRQLSTCEHYAHVLQQFTDDEIRLVTKVARTGESMSSSLISVYKEVQIHGPILFSEHVEALVVNIRHKSDSKLVKQVEDFCKKNGCKLEWMNS